MVEDLSCIHPEVKIADPHWMHQWISTKFCTKCGLIVEHLNGVYMTYSQRKLIVGHKVARYGRRGYGM